MSTSIACGWIDLKSPKNFHNVPQNLLERLKLKGENNDDYGKLEKKEKTEQIGMSLSGNNTECIT